jgi:alpha-ketoglutarate-dependent taurine dioxygenase
MSELGHETAQHSSQSFKIPKFKEHIGAEITGVDLREAIDVETHQRITDALVEHVVLVIRIRISNQQTFKRRLVALEKLCPIITASIW